MPIQLRRARRALPAGFALAILFGVFAGGPAAAQFDEEGPNTGAVLILHHNPYIEFTFGQDYSGYSEIYDCESALTQVTVDEQDTRLAVFFLLAAFDDFASPNLKALTFGIDYDLASTPLAAQAPCGWPGSIFELYTDSWPLPGSGTAISYTEAVTSRLVEIYWFAAYVYSWSSGSRFKVTDHPQRELDDMVDTSVPPKVNQFEDYGRLGFGTEGYNPCATEGEAIGACCSRIGDCIIQTQTGCGLFAGYTFMGGGTTCNPNPCEPGLGACCFRTDCRLLQWDECREGNGVFMGEGVSCEPTPCAFGQVESSWGGVKTIYRGY